ncbi:MAG: diaminopimelate epimerase [Nitrospirae bacterium]|nr:diaminopimelate epimerase [Nitrospirota bacterium]
MQFTKMHSLGNDFVVIDNRNLNLKKLPQLAKKLCGRRFGIGADQLLLLGHSELADFKMRIFNADGSEVEMCGNGIRCLGQYIWHEILRSKITQQHKSFIDVLTIETVAGIKNLKKTGSLIEVDMGEPVLEAEKIPVKIRRKSEVGKQKTEDRRQKTELNSSLVTRHSSLITNYPLKVKDKEFKITCVSMGNPHAVIVVKDVGKFPVEQYGPIIENHRLFPNRTNVEFIQILNRKNIKMRVWERGAGETMACGTGASASAVASALLGLTGRKVTMHLPGGKLLIDWSAQDGHVHMTGDAVKVFDGTVEI